MSNQYEIKTLDDILALTYEQQKNCVVDLAAWLEWRHENKVMIDTMSKLGVLMGDGFIWVDDDRIGEISGITVKFPKESKE